MVVAWRGDWRAQDQCEAKPVRRRPARAASGTTVAASRGRRGRTVSIGAQAPAVGEWTSRITAPPTLATPTLAGRLPAAWQARLSRDADPLGGRVHPRERREAWLVGVACNCCGQPGRHQRGSALIEPAGRPVSIGAQWPDDAWAASGIAREAGVRIPSARVNSRWRNGHRPPVRVLSAVRGGSG